MTERPIEPSDNERAEWPETTDHYVYWLEEQINLPLIGQIIQLQHASGQLDIMEQCAARGLPIKIGEHYYVPISNVVAEHEQSHDAALKQVADIRAMKGGA